MKCKREIIDHSKAKCKYCRNNIKKGENVFILKQVHVSPNFVNLIFHYNCFNEITRTFHNGYLT